MPYLSNLIPAILSKYRTSDQDNLPLFGVQHNFSQKTFSLSAIIEWNKLDSLLQNTADYFDFKKTKTKNKTKKTIMKFRRPNLNSVHDCHNTNGIEVTSYFSINSQSKIHKKLTVQIFQNVFHLVCSSGVSRFSLIYSFFNN